MITFDSIHETYVTFSAGEELTAGQVCRVTGDSTVGPCSDGEDFDGVARQVRCGLAGVVLKGFVELPYTGTAPSAGICCLCADGEGGVKAAGEKEYLVVTVDETAGTVGFFL